MIPSSSVKSRPVYLPFGFSTDVWCSSILAANSRFDRPRLLSVALQRLYSLPRSHIILLNIRTCFTSFRDLCWVPKWGRHLHRMLREIPPKQIIYIETDPFPADSCDFPRLFR
ncbi:heme-dependent oxidative N-demethylase subunit alpha family protein [Acetobacter sp. UBA5411]|uniref:heme-dependent oxidative N-demethylase subunit alpha family protein n=1 Tax=Acetobacter sp. UBA5411 TaxID=1945905 RepID=UPI003BB99D59